MKTDREVARYFIMMITTAIVLTLAVVHLMNEYEYDGGKKYTIQTEHGTYHTDQFRICGKGIAFDTKDKKIIVMGNFNIISNLEQ
jgi:hypothetical protein